MRMDGEIVTPGQYSDLRSSLDMIHILVVDDDPICLSIVAAMLRTYRYDVITVKHPSDALATLRMNRGLIDLVVTDVHMPDMNGFELQKLVYEEFNIPVIMMSADAREYIMWQSLAGGAAFFMVKPLTADDVNNIWQFILARKKGKAPVVYDVEEETGTSDDEFSPVARKKPCHEDIGCTSLVIKGNEEPKQKREYKRKTPKNSKETSGAAGDASKTLRKPKVIWSTGLHNRFLYAINQIGLDKCVPKKILEYMRVPGLTRENIASHLQKYRIFLRRVQDTGSEASWSAVERVLLRSSFAPSHSSLIFNSYQQNYSEYFEQQQQQQQTKRACRPGFGVNDDDYDRPPIYKATTNKGKLLSYPNQQASNSNSVTPSKYGKSHYSSFFNHESPADLRPQCPQYQGLFSGLMANVDRNIDDLMTSPNVMQAQRRSSGLMTNIGTNSLLTRATTTSLPRYQNEAPARQEVFRNNPSSYNDFMTNGLSGPNYTSGFENMGSSYNDIGSNFNNLQYPDNNNNFADTQIAEECGGDFAGYGGDSIEGYVGGASPSDFGGSYFSSACQRENVLAQTPQPPPPLQECQENDGTDSWANLFGSIENSSTFNNNYYSQPFTEEGGLNDMSSLQKINDQSPNQQGTEEFAGSDFSVSPYHVKGPTEILQQPLNQPEGGEEMIGTQNFSDDMYLADDILSWLDSQPNDQDVGEEFMNSELYGMNQEDGGDGTVDSWFRAGSYNP